jgi:outer membrane receptor protein involved in Fe transport
MRLPRILSVGALGLVALLASPARAQTTTAGAIQGTVSDEVTRAPILLVTVVASSPALQGTQSEFTDASGSYFMSNLPPGSYSLLFIYGEAKVRRDNIDVGVGKVTMANANINTQAPEMITITQRAPIIDSGSSKQGVTVGPDYLKNVPSRARTWSGALTAAAGSQADSTIGVGFSGSGGLENNYVVDGLNTTGVTMGQGFPTQGSQVLNNFIQEIEVITGGYNAEFGRSTGGVVNVVTKTGSNELHGSVFANVNPINARIEPIATIGSALRRIDDYPTTLDFGFDLGGPILKDKLWFYVGFAPVIGSFNTTRIAGTRVDRGVNGFNYRNTSCAAKNFDGSCDGDHNPDTTAKPGCELIRAGDPLHPVKGSCETDSYADVDPATNKTLFEEISRQTFQDKTSTYQVTGKLNLALAPEHQGQVSFTGQPETQHQITSIAGTPTAGQKDWNRLNTDLSGKWTSKLFDNKTQIDAVFGWHRDHLDYSPIHTLEPNNPTVRVADHPSTLIYSGYAGEATGNLGAVAVNHDTPEDPRVATFCTDGGTGDEFPTIVNCPVSYTYGSPGLITDSTEQRFAAKVTLTQRVQAAGHHTIKVGVDFESNVLDDLRGSYGGHLTSLFGDDWFNYLQFVNVNPNGAEDCVVADPKSDPDHPLPVDQMCDFRNRFNVHGNTWNLGGFVQDAWSILPNFTVNAGVRYEQQRLAWAEALRNTLDPITGQSIGTDAITLSDLIAPRIGLIYDWTKEGRSKIYANWGRFYESIPMDINNRSFGGEQTFAYAMDARDGKDCGSTETNDPTAPMLPSNPLNCNPPSPSRRGDFPSNSVVGATKSPTYGTAPGVELIMPNIKAQYLDELVIGVEYEVLEDLRVGLSYQNRQLGRVIEDMSPDGASTYFLANPASFSADDEAALIGQIHQHDNDADAMSVSSVRSQLINRLNAFRYSRKFDPPSRTYNAVQLTATKRFSRSFMLQGSYTYQRDEGNYPGLYAPDHAQLDPNITSQYDLLPHMANRFGPLPYDRPHSFKLDGYYTFDLREKGRVTAGARFRLQSGIPYTALGYATQTQYGPLESFLLPRGAGGRTAFQANADLHIAYARKLNAHLELELFFELFNVFNNQTEITVDQDYTDDAADPVVGGSARDLPYVKPTKSQTHGALGLDPLCQEDLNCPHPAVRNLNYGNTTTRLDPLSGRFGATLSF